MYQGNGLTLQLQGQWAVINIVQTGVAASYAESYTNIISLPSEIEFYDNVGFYTVLNFMTQSWVPVNKFCLIVLEHNKLSIKASDNVENGVLVGQFMVPRESISKC